MNKKKDIFQIPAIVDGVSPLKDGGLSIRFHTQEIKTAETVKIMEYYQSFGWLQFSKDAIEEVDIPKDTIVREGKSASQRLRSVIYAYWFAKEIGGDFDVYYNQQIEKLITLYKQKLPEVS